MAVRLSVIMVHSPPPSASAERLGETVVGELIGLSGIDLTLVGALAGIQPSSTDRLTVDSIEGDVAVLDWQTAAETLDVLHRIGLAGQRSPHAHDPEATPVAGTRRVYALDLNRFDDAQQVCDALTRLKASREVRTFSLGGSTDPRTNDQLPVAGQRVGPTDAAPPVLPHTHEQTDEPPADKNGMDLDRLVDELDRFDP